jgi:hypothetical protein
MVERDQAIRNEWINKGADNTDKSLLARMSEIDSKNTARMKEIVRRYGWPGSELVGTSGSKAAFLIVQHAEHDFHRQMLPFVQRAYRSGGLSGSDYALFLDRVLVEDGKPQMYGTRVKPFELGNGKEPVPYPIKDEADVDKRRAEIGLPPLSEYLEGLKRMYFPQNKDKQ